MSKIVDIIARVDENRPNAFSSATKMKWISDLDGKIAADVFLMDIAQIRELEYRYPEGLEKEPLVTFPHDDIYDLWLEAKIDAANGEYNRYQNTMQIYNESYSNFVQWFASVYEPAQGGGDCCFVPRSDLPTYYLTAYGIAVKRGFVGSVDEWLASLKGEKGDPGTDPEAIRQAVEAAVPGAVATALDDALPTAVRKAVAKTLPDAVAEAVPEAAKNAVYEALPDAVSEALGDVPEPKEENDAANKAYVDAGLAGKAPAGFGLGYAEVKVFADINGLDGLDASGFYTVNLEEGGFLTAGYWAKYMQVSVDAYNSVYCIQTLRATQLKTMIQRQKINGEWQPWEHINPPMEVGVEYRTTERNNGKVVYAMKVDCGAWADKKQINVNLNGNTWVNIVDSFGDVIGYNLPYIYNGDISHANTCLYTVEGAANVGAAIRLYGGGSTFSGKATKITIKYTKD